MDRIHKFYLSLGSNVDPEANLASAIRRLRARGSVDAVSSIWESHAVGSTGPDYLNLCLLYTAAANEQELKKEVLLQIETSLGRVRSSDRNAPRTIDIDIMMMDGEALNVDRWDYAFVIMPMAELVPHFPHPTSGRPMQDVAKETETATWIVKRPHIRGKLLESPRV